MILIVTYIILGLILVLGVFGYMHIKSSKSRETSFMYAKEEFLMRLEILSARIQTRLESAKLIDILNPKLDDYHVSEYIVKKIGKLMIGRLARNTRSLIQPNTVFHLQIGKYALIIQGRSKTLGKSLNESSNKIRKLGEVAGRWRVTASSLARWFYPDNSDE